jgi:DNA-binding transcriptional ArsR family regulator
MKSTTRLSQAVYPFALFMQAAGNIHRATILHLLAAKELEIWQIAQKLQVPKNLAAHHLKVLLDTGWIRKEKYGKKVYYNLKESVKDQFEAWYEFATKFEKKTMRKK